MAQLPFILYENKMASTVSKCLHLWAYVLLTIIQIQLSTPGVLNVWPTAPN